MMYSRNLRENVKIIEGYLDDDLSKETFNYRLYANLSGDVRYIHRLLKETKSFEFDKAYEMYQEINNAYHIYPKLDVLSYLQTRKEKKEIILFGAGHDGELYFSLLDAAGISPIAIIDNYCQKISFHGVPIYKPGEYHGLQDATIVITSYKNKDAMYWEMIGRGVPEDQIFVPDTNGLYILSMKEYFDKAIWEGRSNEIFVDAGSYNLYTAYGFAQYAKDYEKIYAFEPDKQNYELCKKNQIKFQLNNLELINAGLWERNCNLAFSRGGDNGTGTSVSEVGGVEYAVKSLDSVLCGKPCTFIKMDIEGSEMMALEGAKETIKKHKPRLAICLYHKPMDLIGIPIYVKELVPEYKLKIRHYSTWFFDTVLYAYIECN